MINIGILPLQICKMGSWGYIDDVIRVNDLLLDGTMSLDEPVLSKI